MKKPWELGDPVTLGRETGRGWGDDTWDPHHPRERDGGSLGIWGPSWLRAWSQGGEDPATQGGGWLGPPVPAAAGVSPVGGGGLRAALGPPAPAGAWAALGASWRGSAPGCRAGGPRVALPAPLVSACG